MKTAPCYWLQTDGQLLEGAEPFLQHYTTFECWETHTCGQRHFLTDRAGRQLPMDFIGSVSDVEGGIDTLADLLCLEPHPRTFGVQRVNVGLDGKKHDEAFDKQEWVKHLCEMHEREYGCLGLPRNAKCPAQAETDTQDAQATCQDSSRLVMGKMEYTFSENPAGWGMVPRWGSGLWVGLRTRWEDVAAAYQSVQVRMYLHPCTCAWSLRFGKEPSRQGVDVEMQCNTSMWVRSCSGWRCLFCLQVASGMNFLPFWYIDTDRFFMCALRTVLEHSSRLSIRSRAFRSVIFATSVGASLSN